MLREYLEGAFPADDDACDSYERFVGGVLAENLVKLDKETLKQTYGLGLKSIKKLGPPDLYGWRYSNLASIKSPCEISRKVYGNCETVKGFRNLMDLVGAHNTVVLARV